MLPGTGHGEFAEEGRREGIAAQWSCRHVGRGGGKEGGRGEGSEEGAERGADPPGLQRSHEGSGIMLKCLPRLKQA